MQSPPWQREVEMGMETNCPNCLALQSTLDSANKRIELLLAQSKTMEENYEKHIKELCRDHALELRSVQEKQ